MEKSILLTDLTNPSQIQKLVSCLQELYRMADHIYTTTAPDGNISALRGTRAIYDNAGTLTYWINMDGVTTWQQIDKDTSLWEVDGTETQLKTADEIDMQSKKIINVTNPASDQDAATKKYVDDNTIQSGDAAGGDLTGTYPNPTIPTAIPKNIQVFTSSGTWTKPAGISTVYVKVWGGGGGGGGTGPGSTSGAGGGAGGYSEGLIAVTGDITVAVGGGGAGGGYNAPGTTGETSSFAGSTTIQATGGVGGGAADGSIISAGGVGSNGSLNLKGGESIPALGLGWVGGGGHAPLGGIGGRTAQATDGGDVPGGGGSGAFSSGNGGAGGAGMVIVYY